MLNSKAIFKVSVALVVALVGAAACLLLVMVASAGSRPAEAQPRPEGPSSPLRYVMQDSPQRLNGEVTTIAKCPRDYQVIGGGFDVHYPTGRVGSPTHIRESRPYQLREGDLVQTGWVVRAQVTSGPSDVKPFTAYAVCAPERLVPRDSVRHHEFVVQVPKDREVTFTPGCGPSYKAIGGGFSLGSRPDFGHLIRTQPNPGADFEKWIVKVGTGEGVSARMGAYAVCVREDLVKDLRLLERTQAGTNVVNVGTERCPQGTYLLSGGGSTREGDAKEIRWSHIRPGGGGGSVANPPYDWAVGAVVRDPGREKRLWSFAMCGTLGDQQAVGKPSGKNPGWGDGEGGGRSKEKGGANPAEKKGAPTTTTTNSDEPLGQDAGGGTTSQF
jgi:hypothetical protein